jgi:hypothetical protein
MEGLDAGAVFRKKRRLGRGERLFGQRNGGLRGRLRISGKYLGLCALLVVALHDLALCGEPIFGIVAGFESTALCKQIGESANFILKVDGHYGAACFAPYQGWLGGRGLPYGTGG